jgi:parvulin-like peptidyl-prolyl isomerase
MQSKKWILGATALSVVLGAGWNAAFAQPDTKNAPKAGNPANRGRRDGQGRGQRTPAQMLQRMIQRETKMVEAASGKTLTDAQQSQLKTAITERFNAQRAAQDRYMTQVTRITGLTEEQFRSKMREQRRGGGGPGGGGGMGGGWRGQ